MGAAGTGLTGSEDREMLDREEKTEGSDGEAQPERLEREVEEIRDNISGIVGELDRRGHELFDWRSQLRKHALLIAAIGASCLVGFGVTVAMGVANRRRRNRPLAKARRLREALSRMIAHPELVAQPRPSVSRKAISAAVSATAGLLAKTLAQQVLDGSNQVPSLLRSRTAE
ncbi:MAG TPA: hypothetical protein VK550_08115 [Polyangiaceae bacterium]|nr:hypothetical protein [Polyangiaceae bacterium]